MMANPSLASTKLGRQKRSEKNQISTNWEQIRNKPAHGWTLVLQASSWMGFLFKVSSCKSFHKLLENLHMHRYNLFVFIFEERFLSFQSPGFFIGFIQIHAIRTRVLRLCSSLVQEIVHRVRCQAHLLSKSTPKHSTRQVVLQQLPGNKVPICSDSL